MNREKRSLEFYVLAIFFTIFVLFLYGPLSAIVSTTDSGAADAAITHECRGLAVIFGIGVVERVLEHGRHSVIVLGRDEEKSVEFADLARPTLRGLVLRRCVEGRGDLFDPVVTPKPAHATERRYPALGAYASPEQLRNEPVTTSCDIYALGGILFHRPDIENDQILVAL